MRVRPGGWDNHTFRLGDKYSVRLPSAARYSKQLAREVASLIRLEAGLPIKVPRIVALGEPCPEFPWRWSIREWLDGEPATGSSLSAGFAGEIGRFIGALPAIDAGQGPLPGPDNFYRGGQLETYSSETRRALSRWPDATERAMLANAWDEATATRWDAAPVWVHGDLALENLLRNGDHLSAVIDWGNVSVGDPACDLAIAWTSFGKDARQVLLETVGTDDATWKRGRAWALWKALIVATEQVAVSAGKRRRSAAIVRGILGELSSRWDRGPAVSSR